MTGTTFALNDLGVKFQVKLVDCITDVNIDTGDIIQQSIILYKPDGSKIEKEAILVEEPEGSNDFFITYVNGSEGEPAETESILDQTGFWEYVGKAKLSNDDEFTTPDRIGFWVV